MNTNHLSPAELAEIEKIACDHLGLTTLETRRSDALDFSDQAVWSLRAALAAAFEAGKQRGSLGAEYKATIGYDPFEDCPDIEPAIVRQTLAEHADEAGEA